LDKPDPYSDWVLFRAEEGEGKIAPPPDDDLISAAREVWPRALGHAKKELRAEGLGSESASLAAQVWERVLRSVSRTRQRYSDHLLPISDLQSYLFGAFVHRFNRTLLREEKRAETIELVSSSLDLERMENAQNAEWVEELERAITISQITDRMDSWTKKVWQARQYGYSWKEISLWLGATEEQARKKFEYGVERTRQNIVRLLRVAKPKKSR
jgi:hypothetical protein